MLKSAHEAGNRDLHVYIVARVCMYVQMKAHGQLGCVLTVDEVAEGVELKGTELENTDMRMIRVRP